MSSPEDFIILGLTVENWLLLAGLTSIVAIAVLASKLNPLKPLSSDNRRPEQKPAHLVSRKKKEPQIFAALSFWWLPDQTTAT
jgi:hypothetical protein